MFGKWVEILFIEKSEIELDQDPYFPSWKAASALKLFCVELWLEKLQENMNRCTGCLNVTKTMLKMASNTNKPYAPTTLRNMLILDL